MELLLKLEKKTLETEINFVYLRVYGEHGMDVLLTKVHVFLGFITTNEWK